MSTTIGTKRSTNTKPQTRSIDTLSVPAITQHDRAIRAEWRLGLARDGLTEYAVMEVIHYDKGDWPDREKCLVATLTRDYLKLGERFTGCKEDLNGIGLILAEKPVARYDQAQLLDFFDYALKVLHQHFELGTPIVERMFVTPAQREQG